MCRSICYRYILLNLFVAVLADGFGIECHELDDDDEVTRYHYSWHNFCRL